MNNEIMISIITPVRNNVLRMQECLQNVMDQNCPACEHIIIDAASQDGTLEIIEQWAMKFKHIRFVSESDTGQAQAMNKGIRLARGKYIGFLNVDDYYEPGVLNRVITHMKELPEPAFIVGNCNVWNAPGQLRYVNKPKRLRIDDLLIPQINLFPVNPSAYFYTRAIHQEIGFYKEDDHYTMDLDFILRAAKSYKLRYVDEIWGNFRLFENTKTFTEIQEGRCQPRVEALMAMNLAALPVHRQLKIRLRQSIPLPLRKNMSRLRKIFNCLMKRPERASFRVNREVGNGGFTKITEERR